MIVNLMYSKYRQLFDSSILDRLVTFFEYKIQVNIGFFKSLTFYKNGDNINNINNGGLHYVI